MSFKRRKPQNRGRVFRPETSPSYNIWVALFALATASLLLIMIPVLTETFVIGYRTDGKVIAESTDSSNSDPKNYDYSVEFVSREGTAKQLITKADYHTPLYQPGDKVKVVVKACKNQGYCSIYIEDAQYYNLIKIIGIALVITGTLTYLLRKITKN